MHLAFPVWWVLLPLFLFSCKDDDPVTPFVRLLEKQKMHSAIFNNDITYAVLLPDGYATSTESYPVVYLLHGYGDDEKAWYTSGGLQYYVDQYAGQIVPMIYVMPAAYYSYYVNKFSGDYPYMDMMTTELVPTIDSLFRTKKDKSARAVMGYSMGGYGALVLPALNPEVFSVAVPLSMSFRTDEQYLEEPQDVFNSQWANLFGGFGATGTARLTDYYILHSPFHFFGTGDLLRFDELKILIDCGDDEESLSITSDELHAFMRDHSLAHEYRVRNGGHSFNYWKKGYPEAFQFISNAVQGIPHPEEPVPATIGSLVPDKDIQAMDINGLTVNVIVPMDYIFSSVNFPVLYLLHDYEDGNRPDNVRDIFSLLRNNMNAGKLTKAIVVEIPVGEVVLSPGMIAEIVSVIDSVYHTINSKQGRIILGNEAGGALANSIVSADPGQFGSCFLFNALMPDQPESPSDELFYYLDVTDECSSYRGYQQFYYQIRQENVDYEYRVRQGGQNYQAFINGLSESVSSIKESLMN
jgi:S-formylglutathione hydrolase FrmB